MWDHLGVEWAGGPSGPRRARCRPPENLSHSSLSLPSLLIWTKYVPELPGASRASPGAPGAAHVLPHHVRSSGSRMGQSPPGAPGDPGGARARPYIPLVNRHHSSGAAEDLRLDRICIATLKKSIFFKLPRGTPDRPQSTPEGPRSAPREARGSLAPLGAAGAPGRWARARQA